MYVNFRRSVSVRILLYTFVQSFKVSSSLIMIIRGPYQDAAKSMHKYPLWGGGAPALGKFKVLRGAFRHKTELL
jgi:hypothetical protein